MASREIPFFNERFFTGVHDTLPCLIKRGSHRSTKCAYLHSRLEEMHAAGMKPDVSNPSIEHLPQTSVEL